MMKFSPQQTRFLLERKGLTFGTPAAAKELARMALKADARLKKHAQEFQQGGMVGNMENTSTVNAPAKPTPPSTPESTKVGLDAAQSRLADAELKLANLAEQLANLATDGTQDVQRDLIEKQINQQRSVIAQSQSGLATASQAFGTVAVPTAAEAVGMGVSTPTQVVTPTAVSQIGFDQTQAIAAGTGEVGGDIDPITAAQAEAAQTSAPTITDTNLATTTETADAVASATQDMQAPQGSLSPEAIIEAAQQDTADLGIQDVVAAETQGTQIDSPAKRKLEEGERVSAVANAEKASQFTEGIEAATGAPTSQATVQGQLTGLMNQFEGGEPPAWAAGAMRNAVAMMAQRGMSASSMAGQAVLQAAMESAMPIAMADAQTYAQFDAQNLSNRQQMQMLRAEQRAKFMGMEFDQAFQARVMNAAKVSDIANVNFSAEQQIALENARLAQTADLANLNNRQAVIMAQAAAVQQADMTNLNNRQQAAVQNASSFLQMDMANFDANQQTEMFKNQSVVQSLFTDAAAENAASQFNATSQNQTDQFFANLSAQVAQSNTAQQNAINQFNVGEENALNRFQEEINNQRDQFNATNQLVIAQSNAQWRQNLATINNAAQNEANRQDALQANNLTQKSLDEIWQKERDLMHYAFASAETAAGRRHAMIMAELNADATVDSAWSQALGTFGGAIIGGLFEGGSSSIIGGLF